MPPILKNKKLGKKIALIIAMSAGLYFSYDEFMVKKEPPNKKHEDYYQTIMCNKLNGLKEYVLDDRTRVDCLTDDYAIEVDWAKKWAEGIGQALFYAEKTQKKPAVALIIGKKDQKYLKRLEVVANKFNIKIIKIKKEVGQ